MNHHELKSPLVEEVVAAKSRYYFASLVVDEIELTRAQKMNLFLEYLFQLRRELWQRSVAWLMEERTRIQADKKLLAL